MEMSKLRFYSIGTVAANKDPSSNIIEVTPLEDLKFVDGELTDNVDVTKTQGQDSEGVAYQHEIDTTVTVPATWLAIGQSNRLTAPDVERGATVVLYRFANDDEIWWTTLQNDMHLRRLETVIFGIKATTVLDQDPGPDNMYWIEMSSHRKVVHFHTSKANGEFCTYDVQFDLKDGKIVIQDDLGNDILFDSKNTRIEIINADKSFVNIDKKVITLKSADEINVLSKVINIKADETINQEAGTAINEKTKTHSFKADTMNITATNVKSVATWAHAGKMNSSGIIKSDEDVQAKGVSVINHIHTGVRAGPENSGKPQQ